VQVFTDTVIIMAEVRHCRRYEEGYALGLAIENTVNIPGRSQCDELSQLTRVADHTTRILEKARLMYHRGRSEKGAARLMGSLAEARQAQRIALEALDRHKSGHGCGEGGSKLKRAG